MTLLHVRLAAVALGFLALITATWRYDRVVRGLRTFFSEPTSPVNLAILRVVVFGILFSKSLDAEAAWFTGLPDALRELPRGWKWLESILPLEPTFAARVENVFMLSSALACAGLMTRANAPLAAVSAVYVLGVPNFYLKINHGNHAVVLCSLILAFAPCADALALDRVFHRTRGRAAPQPSTGYTLPIRLCWLILGTVYLFPGLWKLWDSGDLWISGVKLQSKMIRKWGQLRDFEPLFRIDRYPWLFSVLGTWTLVFEVGFFFALFKRSLRVVFALNACAFHLGVQLLMGIHFNPLFPLVLLIDFPQLPRMVGRCLPGNLRSRVKDRVHRVRARVDTLMVGTFGQAHRAPPARNAALASIVGIILVFGQLVAGFAPIDTWPVAVHPRFSSRKARVPNEMDTTQLVLVSEDGTRKDLGQLLEKLGLSRKVPLTRMLERISRAPRRFKRRARMLVGLFRENGAQMAPGDRILVYNIRWDIFPLAQRDEERQKLVGRYRVTDDLGLAVEKH